MRAVANWLLRRAAKLMPPERAKWVDGMRNELAYLPRGQAVIWAMGCLLAALKERGLVMHSFDLRVSRWVMLIETLGCFGLLTLMGFALIFDDNGFIHHTWPFIKSQLTTLEGTFVYAFWVLGAIVGLVGPIGLFLGLRYVISGTALRSRPLGYALIAITLSSPLMSLLGLFVGPPEWEVLPGFMLLVNVLPSVAIAHLMYLGRQPKGVPPAGATAA